MPPPTRSAVFSAFVALCLWATAGAQTLRHADHPGEEGSSA